MALNPGNDSDGDYYFPGISPQKELTDAEVDTILAHPLYLRGQKEGDWDLVYDFFYNLSQPHLLKLLLDPKTTKWGIQRSDKEYMHYNNYWPWALTLVTSIVKFPEIVPEVLKDPRCILEYKLDSLSYAAKYSKKSFLAFLKDPEVSEYLSRPHNCQNDRCVLEELFRFLFESEIDSTVVGKLERLQLFMSNSEIYLCKHIFECAERADSNVVAEKKMLNIIRSRAQGDEFGGEDI